MNNPNIKNETEPVLELKSLSKVFRQGHKELVVLDKINLQVYAGDEIAIIGSSGSGKSTLLQTASLLEKPSSGEVHIHGQNGWRLSDNNRAYLRRFNLGFVYQFHHLLAEFSAIENVMMPLLVRGEKPGSAKEKAMHYLKRLGLENRCEHRPAQLSGGEQQRVAILRALVTEPKILLADEPTGNLDHATAKQVFDEFIGLTREHQSAVIMVTHDQNLASKFKSKLELEQGRLNYENKQSIS